MIGLALMTEISGVQDALEGRANRDRPESRRGSGGAWENALCRGATEDRVDEQDEDGKRE
jgi:hypothetical protein